jgi:hypothetical protein
MAMLIVRDSVRTRLPAFTVQRVSLLLDPSFLISFEPLHHPLFPSIGVARFA